MFYRLASHYYPSRLLDALPLPGTMMLPRALAPLRVELRVACFPASLAAITRALLWLTIGALFVAASVTGTFPARRAFLTQQVNEHTHRIESELVSFFNLAGARTRNIQSVHVTLADEFGYLLGSLPRLHSRSVYQLVGFGELNAIIEGTFRAAFDLAEVDDCRSVTFNDILPGAVTIIATGEFFERILFRDDAVFGKTTFRTPSTTLDIKVQGSIEHTTVNAGLSARNDSYPVA
ncbi:MAG: hypothetical protein PVI98_09655 [Burkholderiales bacterium]